MTRQRGGTAAGDVSRKHPRYNARMLTRMLASLVAMLLPVALYATPPMIPEAIPHGFGVNIHFTRPAEGEMKMLADAGFKFVRMDFSWVHIEKERGVYDFSEYDVLVDALEAHGMRAMFILDYAHPLYDDDLSPHTDEGRKAFARFALAGARHFKGRNILWEMYNEPNIAPFWRPSPNVDDYIALALEVGRTLRRELPHEIYIGPATSGIDLPFLEACFKAGLLDYWSAVTVHPYRQQAPETVADDYRKLRLLIAKYAPRGRHIPILSGEWGYSSIWHGFDHDRQGKFLPRQFLTNLINEIPLSIWYDWRDDGMDEKDPEHHFGTVLHPHHPDRDPAFDPKPAYLSAQTLLRVLDGFYFNKRLALDSADDYFVLFHKDGEVRVAAWTTASEPRRVAVPLSPGKFRAISHLGEELDDLELPAREANAPLPTIELSDAPIYLVPRERNALLYIAASWDRAPLGLIVTAPDDVALITRFRNPFDVPLGVILPSGPLVLEPGQSCPVSALVPITRGESQRAFRIQLRPATYPPIFQQSYVVVRNPLRLTILPAMGDVLPVRIENPVGDVVKGELILKINDAVSVRANIITGEKQTQTIFDFPARIQADHRVAAELVSGERVLVRSPTQRFALIPLKQEAFELPAGGDASVASEQSFNVVDAPDGLPAAAPAIQIDYDFDAGWKYICLSPRDDLQAIEGKPARLGLWIKGDSSGNIPRMRFVDATNQTFQPDGPKLVTDDWTWVEYPLDGSQAGHWGGASDGVVHYPIRLQTLFLLDSASRQPTSGTIHIAAPALIYSE